MNLRGTERKSSGHAEDAGQFLASRYAQLMRWALILCRNDRSRAEEIVQEFCLYISLTKQDFTHVSNLDGYLYTCLRHIYASSLARASRDALRLLNLEDYDSLPMAVTSRTHGDALQQQNDLRRACAYAVWRKESSKTASYFILHLFHGYERQEIADLARVTMATIYNKLKAARAEVGTYLQDAGKLKLVSNEGPPPPRPFWHLVTVTELFSELRQTILTAKLTACMQEHALRALYSDPTLAPIPCDLLAHIVSCERCLSILDDLGRRPTLKDREPLDVLGFSPREGEPRAASSADESFEEMMKVVRQKERRVHQHRPRSLSIALNGEVIATHDIRAGHNRLSARTEASERARFVEVFSEQDVRLALLSLEEWLPETNPTQQLHVELSDRRWLELHLRMDGQGLEFEVLYADPVLSQIAEDDETPVISQPLAGESRTASFREAARRRLRFLFPPVLAWALLLVMTAGSGLWFYSSRQTSPGAAMMLSRASQLQTAALRGQTEHEVVRIEELSPDGGTVSASTVDVWKDGDGSRYIRSLYDDHHRLLASEWQGKGQAAARQRSLRQSAGVVSQFWNQELSADAFAGINTGEPRMQATTAGFEITKVGSSQKYPQLVSATLVLNHRYEAVEQRLQVQTASGVRQVRFIRETYEIRPSRAVPDETFEAPGEMGGRRGRSLSGVRGLGENDNAKLAELEISGPYALHTLNADTGVPIQVARTPAGRLQVTGTVANDNLRRQITERLHGLANAYFLDLKLASSAQVPARNLARSGPVKRSRLTRPAMRQMRLCGAIWKTKTWPASRSIRRWRNSRSKHCCTRKKRYSTPLRSIGWAASLPGMSCVP